MKFPIKNRYTGAVQFEGELEARYESASYGVQLGAAVKQAIAAHANLAGASLADANLTRANLAGAYLAGADLAHAYLIDGGQERRGYLFWAWRHKDGHVVYRAGCREWQSLDAALAHFGKGYAGSGDPAECIARLRLMERCARERGWIGGTDQGE